jgi:hypothetical protein
MSLSDYNAPSEMFLTQFIKIYEGSLEIDLQ